MREGKQLSGAHCVEGGQGEQDEDHVDDEGSQVLARGSRDVVAGGIVNQIRAEKKTKKNLKLNFRNLTFSTRSIQKKTLKFACKKSLS